MHNTYEYFLNISVSLNKLIQQRFFKSNYYGLTNYFRHLMTFTVIRLAFIIVRTILCMKISSIKRLCYVMYISREQSKNYIIGSDVASFQGEMEKWQRLTCCTARCRVSKYDPRARGAFARRHTPSAPSAICNHTTTIKFVKEERRK